MTAPGAVQSAVLDLQPVGGNPVVPDSVEEAASTAAAALELVRVWISDRHNWVRLGWFAAGYTMIIVGVAILAKPSVDQAAASVGKITKGII